MELETQLPSADAEFDSDTVSDFLYSKPFKVALQNIPLRMIEKNRTSRRRY